MTLLIRYLPYYYRRSALPHFAPAPRSVWRGGAGALNVCERRSPTRAPPIRTDGMIVQNVDEKMNKIWKTNSRTMIKWESCREVMFNFMIALLAQVKRTRAPGWNVRWKQICQWILSCACLLCWKGKMVFEFSRWFIVGRSASHPLLPYCLPSS